MHHFTASFGEDDEQFDEGGDDERGDCPGNDGDETLQTLNEDDAGAEDHDEFVGDTTQSPTLALREKDFPVLGNDCHGFGTEGLGGLFAGEETENDGRVNTVFRVITHDMLCHDIIRLRTVAKALTKNSIAKGSFINTNELTASRKTIDLSCDARLKHTSETLSLGILNRLIQRPVSPIVTIKINADMATYTNELWVLADLLDHLPDTVFVKHGVGIHTAKVSDIIKTSVDEVVADVFEQLIIEHGDNILGALLEMVNKRPCEAETVAFALVVALSDEDVRNTLVETSLCLDRHE